MYHYAYLDQLRQEIVQVIIAEIGEPLNRFLSRLHVCKPAIVVEAQSRAHMEKRACNCTTNRNFQLLSLGSICGTQEFVGKNLNGCTVTVVCAVAHVYELVQLSCHCPNP